MEERGRAAAADYYRHSKRKQTYTARHWNRNTGIVSRYSPFLNVAKNKIASLPPTQRAPRPQIRPATNSLTYLRSTGPTNQTRQSHSYADADSSRRAVLFSTGKPHGEENSAMHGGQLNKDYASFIQLRKID